MKPPLTQLYINICCLFLFILLSSSLSAASLKTAAASTEILEIPVLLKKMAEGGLVIYWRHAHTDRSRSDQRPLDVSNCDKQRKLDDTGREQARTVGSELKKLQIIISELYSSPYCRCMDTAKLALTLPATIATGLSYLIGLPPSERQIRTQYLLSLMKNPPSKGNRMIVSHTANLRELTGIWPNQEGDMVVFEAGSPPHLLGYIPIEYWVKK